jgi:hypothetical protein
MKRLTLYIGADNDTGLIDRETIRRWADDHFPEGYTLIDGKGYWRGNQETTCILTNISKEFPEIVKEWVALLRSFLNQQSILMVIDEVEATFV